LTASLTRTVTIPLLLFIRHGETDWNAEGRLQGQRDLPLNGVGRRQADACAEIVQNLLQREGRAPEDFDFVASPLSRARETMQRLRDGLRLESSAYRTDARLLEVSFGAWEGRTIPELSERDPAGILARERDSWNFVPPAGESYALMSARVQAWYAERHARTIAVAHGGTLRVLMALLGIVSPAMAALVPIEQGTVYDFRGDQMSLHRWRAPQDAGNAPEFDRSGPAG
jgi:probable phosphoglycerate mutase